MFYFKGNFALPEVLILNILGQILDACLFIYLVNHFFPVRRQDNPSRFQGQIMTVLMAAILFGVDLFFHNAFYPYYIAMFSLYHTDPVSGKHQYSFHKNVGYHYG